MQTSAHNAKQEMLDIISSLPDDVPLADLLEMMEERMAVLASQADLEAHGGVPHDEAVKSIRQWNTK